MKCPICNEELDVYDIDERFAGNYDKYADCNKCHHSFIFYYRYHHLWKYDIWEQYYDENDKTYYSDDKSLKTIIVYKGDKK